MSEGKNLPSYLIVLGTTYSGSGAVYDYLSGRGDLYDPLKGTEYQLPQMPNGLMALEATANKSFHPATSDFVLDQFIKIIQKLDRPRTPWQYGKNYASMIPSFRKNIDEFIEEITAAKFSMNWHWRRLMKSQSPLVHFLSKLKNRIGLPPKVEQTRLIVSEKDFVIATQILHKKIFIDNSEGRIVLLNQAGSGWNPLESTKYFSKRKVLLIIRDPRDQFYEIKKYKKAKSVEDFIYWYLEMQKRIEKINKSDLLIIQFEEFVNNYSEKRKELCNYIPLSKNINSNYNPHLSKKNIGKYKKYLSQKEILIIEKKLSKFLIY